MASGKEKHRARLDAIGLLGKDLARRANRNCELCEGKGDISPYDTAPEDDPTMDTIALLCERCRAIADGRDDAPETIRFLAGAIWSPYGGVSSVARTVLGRVDTAWAREALEMLD